MSNSNPPGTSNPATPVTWDPDVIFHILGHPVRRRLLLALAKDGPKTANDLLQLSSSKSRDSESCRDSASKQLAVMRESGLVLMKDNRADRRRQLYVLSPSVKVTKTETETVIDFGFCTLRF